MNKMVSVTDMAPVRQSFPTDFIWGVATSAFQIEGASQADGKGESIWDNFCRKPGVIADGSNGDVACDHYHRFAEDLDLVRDLGVDAYRFSLAWPRVQPAGRGAWNEAGFAFYDRLIDSMLDRGLRPFLTLYHWDLPQALQEQGGWNARDTCHRFADYAAEVMRRFGDRVASVTTHNEPWVVAILGHETGIFAPGLKTRKIAYQAAHHLLLSHGMAVAAMRSMRKPVPMGIVLNQSPFYPLTQDPADQAKAELEYGLLVRWYMDPLLEGHYPQDLLEHLGNDAPEIAAGDLDLIRSPLDFIGINYYTRQVSSAKGPFEPAQNGLPVTDMGWEIYPDGLTDLLVQLKNEYPLPPLYITENGAAFKEVVTAEGVHDMARVEYLKSHISAVHAAIAQGVDVRGYFLWSLLDNFEWASGYAKRFGIIYVDYETLARQPKQSAHWYREFLRD
jgi:beta-glucosidase